MRGATVDTVLAVPIAIGAGASFAFATVLQQQAARSAPPSDSLHLRLLVDLVRNPVWVGGVVLGVFSFALQGLALAFGPLALVQPLIVSDLLFALPIAARRRRVRPRRREYSGALAIAGGLSVFLVLAHPTPGVATPPLGSWVPALAGIGSVAAVVSTLGRRASGTVRTSLLGAAAGAMFGLMSGLLKTVTELLQQGVVLTLESWETWALAPAAIAGFVLAQSAFQAGPLAVSLPLIDVFEPVTGTLIGATVFGETLPTSGGGLAGAVIGSGLVVIGIVLLDSSPLVREAQRSP